MEPVRRSTRKGRGLGGQQAQDAKVEVLQTAQAGTQKQLVNNSVVASQPVNAQAPQHKGRVKKKRNSNLSPPKLNVAQVQRPTPAFHGSTPGGEYGFRNPTGEAADNSRMDVDHVKSAARIRKRPIVSLPELSEERSDVEQPPPSLQAKPSQIRSQSYTKSAGSH